MVEEEKKDKIAEGEAKKGVGEQRAVPPPKKPDFDEEKLRREVDSIPLKKLKEKYPTSIDEVFFYAGDVIVRVRTEILIDICSFLKEDPEISMDYLSCITGIDYPEREKRFDLVYHLYSISKNHRLTLKTAVGTDEIVPSVTGLWKTADWHEREAYDLLGINFSGHPHLERILTSEDFEGHPLRKDFPAEGRPEDHRKYR